MSAPAIKAVAQIESVHPEVAALARLIANRIDAEVSNLKQQWEQPVGTPTRHFIVDDLLPGETAERIYAAFPKDARIWFQHDTFRERKKTFAKLEAIDPLIGYITDAFHTDVVLDAVRNVTGLQGLEADPELYAGGISMMGKGDFLNPHIDNSHDAGRNRYRRLNLLYYISPNWTHDNGGNFELWDPKVTQPKELVSKYNRLVVMETNRFSWHSVNPVRVDDNRCCISNYYFSSSSPEARPYYHVTSFVGRPDQTFARAWGRVDNFMRQWIAVNLKKTRGKDQSRFSN
jgi:Rps23 Pro-64 3,4-dihydroxylase Tpa1-like proline 4-hydroxylase